jgi:hypothetical protein
MQFFPRLKATVLNVVNRVENGLEKHFGGFLDKVELGVNVAIDLIEWAGQRAFQAAKNWYNKPATTKSVAPVAPAQSKPVTLVTAKVVHESHQIHVPFYDISKAIAKAMPVLEQGATLVNKLRRTFF